MIALAQPDAYPLLLLKGRIAYRTKWAMRWRPRAKRMHDKGMNWVLEYDEEHNFAHMGARFIEDEDWGAPKKAKKKPSKLSPEATRFLELARAARPVSLTQDE